LVKLNSKGAILYASGQMSWPKNSEGNTPAFKLQPPQEEDSLRFAYFQHHWSAMWYVFDPSNSYQAATAYYLKCSPQRGSGGHLPRRWSWITHPWPGICLASAPFCRRSIIYP